MRLFRPHGLPRRVALVLGALFAFALAAGAYAGGGGTAGGEEDEGDTTGTFLRVKAMEMSFLPESVDTKAEIKTAKERLSSKIDRFKEAFRSELNKAGRGHSGLANHASFFATLYLFTVVRTMHHHPSMPGDRILEEAARVCFAEETLAAFASFMTTEISIHAASNQLSQAGIRAGSRLLRFGASAIGHSAGFAGHIAAEGTLQIFAVNKSEDGRQESQAESFAAAGDPAIFEKVAHDYFDRSSLQLLREALDPARLDYGLILLEAAAMIGAGLAAEALTLNPLLVPAAALTAAAAVHFAVEAWRSHRFDPSALEREYAAEVASRLDGPPRLAPALHLLPRELRREIDPGWADVLRPRTRDPKTQKDLDTALARIDAARRIAHYVRQGMGGVDLFTEKANKALAHLQTAHQEVYASVIRAAVYALGRDGFLAEKVRLEVRFPRRGRAQRRKTMSVKARFRKDFDVASFGAYLGLAASDPAPEGKPFASLVAPLAAKVSRSLAKVTDEECTLDDCGLPEDVVDTIKMARTQYCKARIAVKHLIDLRTREDEAVDALRKSCKNALPKGFLRVLAAHRAGANDRTATCALVVDKMKEILNRPIDGGKILERARALWQQRLKAHYERAGEEAPPVE